MIKNRENIYEEQIFSSTTDIPVEEELEDSGIVMDKPFNPKDIDIKTKTMSMYNIIQRLREDEIDLAPDFQRNKNLWNAATQSRLIESLLIKFPLPAFYFDGSNDDKWLVVDGLQRLSAIKNFTVTGELALCGLEFLTSLENKHFNELPRTYQRQIEEAEIMTYIINPGTPEDVKFNIFKRINTGGLVLTPQEIRHALNQGVPANFVAELAQNKYFIQATGKIDSRRMLDREFVTRFLAFYIHPPTEYRPDLDTFMNASMKQLNELSHQERDLILYNFSEAMKLSKNVFGKWAFRKVYDKSQKRFPINKALFEVWSVIFAKLSDEERKKVLKNKTTLFSSFINLINNDPIFANSITSSTGDKTRVNYRFSQIEQLVKKVYD